MSTPYGEGRGTPRCSCATSKCRASSCSAVAWSARSSWRPSSRWAREPILKWMFWTGLLVTAADVLIALAPDEQWRQVGRQVAVPRAQGVLALAQVTAISETGTRINDQPLVKINLHIEGPGLTPIDGQDRVIASVTRLPLDHRAQAGRPGRPGHQYLPDRLGEKRSGQRSGSGTVHARRGQPDLRPVRAGRPSDGDHADPQGQQHPDARHHRHPVESCCASAGDGRGAARGARGTRSGARGRARRGSHHRRPSTAQRLQELETLRATGTISEAEYTAKRQQIIAAL